MFLRLKLRIFLTVIITFLSFNSFSQDKLQLINNLLILSNNLNESCCGSYFNTNQPFFDGVIILQDDTTLKGRLSLNQPFKNKYVSILEKDGVFQLIDNINIKEVTFFENENNETLETKFTIILDDEKLYRTVFDNGTNIVVYDSFSEPFNGKKLEGKVLVKDEDELTDTWNFWTSGPKKDIINYLNQRDGTTYKRRDFKTLEDLFAKL